MAHDRHQREHEIKEKNLQKQMTQHNKSEELPQNKQWRYFFINHSTYITLA